MRPVPNRSGDKRCLDAGFGEPVRYRLHGNPSCAPIAVLGGISADRFCERWWSPVVGPDGALDPRHRRILSFDWLATGTAAAGEVSTADQADALARVLDHLGMERMEALVGASYGAMVGLAFAARHPARLGRLIAISGAHRSTPSATARRLV
ncbi:MAG: alpha/beta fold hydrolase, partial [Wenzhouxiangellaceae bacterium]|nr:alpha/beta fold hydrolase [Wenzhouxiangellaceae bacterium]